MIVDTGNLAVTVINVVSWLLYILILARILISWLPIHPWHPVVRWLRIIVDPILAPFRRILPSVAGLDLSPLLAILVIFFVAHIATGAIEGSLSIPALIVSLIVQLIQAIIIILGIMVLIRLLLGLFNADPFHPLTAGIRSMTNPLVRPFAGFKRGRSLTGLDVPALLTLILYLVLFVVVQIVFNTLLAHVR